MKNRILFLLLVITTLTVKSQNNTLYLVLDKPFFQYQTIENINIGFVIESNDKRFVCDYYKFKVLNYQGWNKKGEDIFLSLKELRKEVNLNDINYETISSLSKNKKWWEIHDILSLKKKIYLLEKKSISGNKNKDSTQYYIMPMIYEGTRKNIVPTDLSFKKE